MKGVCVEGEEGRHGGGPHAPVTGFPRLGAQMGPFGPSILTVKASIPARTWGCWQSLGTGSQELRCLRLTGLRRRALANT